MRVRGHLEMRGAAGIDLGGALGQRAQLGAQEVLEGRRSPGLERRHHLPHAQRLGLDRIAHLVGSDGEQGMTWVMGGGWIGGADE